MPRKRINYQSVGLFAARTDVTQSTGNIKQATHLQNVDYSFDIPFSDVSRLGRAAAEKIQIEAPTVPLNVEYFNVDFYNEKNIFGLTVDNTNSAVSALLQKIGDERNYYVGYAPEGIDFQSTTAALMKVIGVGNGFLTSFSASAAVGDFAKTSIGIEGLNICGYNDGVNENVPNVDPTNGALVAASFNLPVPTGNITGQPIVIGKGDIVVTIPETAPLFQGTGMPIQSYNISFDFNRQNIEQFGTKYAISKDIQFPIDLSVQIEALTSDIQTGCLGNLLCDTNGHTLVVTLNQPICGVQATRTPVARYEIRNAKLQSQTYGVSVGGDETTTMSFISTIAGSGDNANGLFLSGITNYTVNGSGISNYTGQVPVNGWSGLIY